MKTYVNDYMRGKQQLQEDDEHVKPLGPRDKLLMLVSAIAWTALLVWWLKP